MRTGVAIVALLCMALALPSCGTEDIGDYVNEYVNTARWVSDARVALLEGFTRYEAEDAMLFGNAVITDGDAYLYSGGKTAGNLTNNIDPARFPLNWNGRTYVKFAVTAPKNGVYLVDLVTNGPGAKTIMIRVNDIENKAHNINSPGEWNRMFVERFRLGLWKGVHYICITGDVHPTRDQWINIDCIDVSMAPEP
jgi:hypothetical protein